MPNIKIIYWNVENFGDDHNGRRGNYVPLCNFIAQVVQNVDADILCLMELKQTAVAIGGINPLALLQQVLHNLAPATHWYYDWIKGSLSTNAQPPYNTQAHTQFTIAGRNEGYAVFWKQNIAKFTMQPADPIDPATVGGVAGVAGAAVANTQSGQVRSIAQIAGVGINFGIALTTDIVVPAAQYIHNGAILAPGTVIPAGTQIHANGIQLNNPINGVNPIVVPGGYTLTDNLTLPAVGSVIVPQHILSLVLSGRDGNPPNNFPGNAWIPLTMAGGIGVVNPTARKPAYFTIQVNNDGSLDKVG